MENVYEKLVKAKDVALKETMIEKENIYFEELKTQEEFPETLDKDKDSVDNSYQLRAKENTSQVTSPDLKIGDNNQESFASSEIEQTKSKTDEFFEAEDVRNEEPDQLETEETGTESAMSSLTTGDLESLDLKVLWRKEARCANQRKLRLRKRTLVKSLGEFVLKNGVLPPEYSSTLEIGKGDIESLGTEQPLTGAEDSSKIVDSENSSETPKTVDDGYKNTNSPSTTESSNLSVTGENQSEVAESSKKDDSTLSDSCLIPKERETVDITLEAVVPSSTEESLLNSTEVESLPRNSEFLETKDETLPNESSLGTSQDKNGSEAVDDNPIKRTRKRKRKKKFKLGFPSNETTGDVGSLTGMEEDSSKNTITQSGNQGVQKQKNLPEKKSNGKQVNPPKKKKAKQSKHQRGLSVNPRFSFGSLLGTIIRNHSNMQIVQQSLSGIPPLLPLMQTYQLGNSVSLLHQQHFLGNVSPPPLMNQRPFSGNSGLPSLMQANPLDILGNLSKNQMNASLSKVNLPSYQGSSSGNPGNLPQNQGHLEEIQRNQMKNANHLRYHENHDLLRNKTSLSRNEANPSWYQGNLRDLPRDQTSRSYNESHYLQYRENLEDKGNLSGSQEYPPRYQEDLLARPSTSKIELQSRDYYYPEESSLRSLKRGRYSDSSSHSPDDYKTARSSERELTPRSNDLTRLIISKDFGRASLSSEELMLIRIEISQEIDRIRTGFIPRFNDTYLRPDGIIVECADEWSRDWLTDRLPKIQPWCGARLRAIDPQSLEKFHEAIIFIPGIIEDANIILRRLEKQNPTLKTGNWKVYSEEERYEKNGYDLMVRIPSSSMKVLKELNFKPFLGMNKVTVTITRSED